MSRHITRMEIASWPGYIITSEGHVYGQKGGRLSPGMGRSGYHQVVLARGVKIRRTVMIHHLMLETFVGPRPEGHEARHLDGNRLNNDISNLCWGSRTENARDRIVHGTQVRGIKHGRAKLTQELVAEARRLNKSGIGSDRLALRFGVAKPTMWSAISRQTWAHVP